jgi:hypothetical protein
VINAAIKAGINPAPTKNSPQIIEMLRINVDHCFDVSGDASVQPFGPELTAEGAFSVQNLSLRAKRGNLNVIKTNELHILRGDCHACAP